MKEECFEFPTAILGKNLELARKLTTRKIVVAREDQSDYVVGERDPETIYVAIEGGEIVEVFN